MCLAGHGHSQERVKLAEVCRKDEEGEGRIWVDLLVGELHMFVERKASYDSHPSFPYTPEI